jgi:hypothetical protein
MKNWNQYREIPVDCMQPVMCVFVLIFMIIFLTTGFSEQGFPRIFTGLNYYTGSSLQLLQGMGLQWRCFHGEICGSPSAMWTESAPTGWNRVKVSEILGATRSYRMPQ